MSKRAPEPAPSLRRPPSIQIAFRTVWRTIKHGYENIGSLLMISLIWFVGIIIFLPVTLLLSFIAQAMVGAPHYELLLLPAGALTAALHRVTRPMSEERAARWQDVFKHVRADWRWSSLLMAVLILGFVVIQVNIRYYLSIDSAALRVLAIIFMTLFIVWAGTALFAFPLALRQDNQRLRTILRNALLITMANAPGVLVSLILLTILLIILLIPPLFFIIPGVAALWAQENARLLLVAAGLIPKDPIADRERGT